MAMSFTYDDGYDRVCGGRGCIRTVTATWTSSSSGAASGTTEKINGLLLKGVTNPTDGPTDDYDIVLTDSESANLLSGCADDLADRDTSNTETVHFLVSDGSAGIAVHPAVNDPITVTVSNAGDTKSGVLVLYYLVRVV